MIGGGVKLAVLSAVVVTLVVVAWIGWHPFAAAAERPCVGREGTASWYSYGTRTASGERFNPDGLSAAMFGVPFGTRVRVTDMATGRSVVVVVDDTGGFRRLGRLIDLSRGAAGRLGMLDRGIARVCVSLP